MSGNLYETLGISQQATPDEIKKAFRQLAVKHHPDKGGDEEIFKCMLNAYEILSDPDKRARYDRFGTVDEPPQQPAPPGGGGGFFWSPHQGGFFSHQGGVPMDPFGDMFSTFVNMNIGGGRPRQQQQAAPSKAPDVTGRIQITLADLFHGLQRTFLRELVRPCASCTERCPQCKGEGRTVVVRQIMPGFQQQTVDTCRACMGRGQAQTKSECTACGSQRTIKETKELLVQIPPGIHEGFQVTFPGMGEQAVAPKEPGDLILNVHIVPDPAFERRGYDLVVRRSIPFIKTVTGMALIITLPNQEALTVQTRRQWNEIIRAQKEYMLPNKGIPIYDNDKKSITGHGNLTVIFDIEYNSYLSPEVDLETLAALEEVFYTIAIRA